MISDSCHCHLKKVLFITKTASKVAHMAVYVQPKSYVPGHISYQMADVAKAQQKSLVPVTKSCICRLC